MGKMDVGKLSQMSGKTRILGEANFSLFFVAQKTMVNPGMIHPWGGMSDIQHLLRPFPFLNLDNKKHVSFSVFSICFTTRINMKEVQSSHYLRALGSDLLDCTLQRFFLQPEYTGEKNTWNKSKLKSYSEYPHQNKMCVSEDEFLGNSRF